MSADMLDKARERYARARRALIEAEASLARAKEVEAAARGELEDARKWFLAYGGVET
jgi:hypothetical protein